MLLTVLFASYVAISYLWYSWHVILLQIIGINSTAPMMTKAHNTFIEVQQVVNEVSKEHWDNSEKFQQFSLFAIRLVQKNIWVAT